MEINSRKPTVEKKDNLYRWRFLLVGICLVAGAIPRFMDLDTIPGLEHDEALICLGAAEIVEQNSHPLTGDKVYEGPLLEYVIAFFMKIFGISVLTARCVMAAAGVLAILLIYWAGAVWGGWRTGLYSAMLMIFSAWHLASSRVIYACNLSQVFIALWIACIGLYLTSHKNRHFLFAGLALGLAANGRFTAYFLIVPTLLMILVFEKKQKWTHLALFPVICALPSAPLLLYNIRYSWPAFSVLKGSGQEHLLHQGSQLCPRIFGFIMTAFSAMVGKKFWLDFDWTPAAPIYILPILVIFGCLAVFNRQKLERSRSRWLIYTLAALLIVVPLVTKIGGNNRAGYHPHYLDLVMPFFILLAAFGLALLDTEKVRLGMITALTAVLWQVFLLFGQLLPHIQQKGLPGRWTGRSTLLAHCIERNFNADDTTVIVPWRFGAGYPEIAFTLRDFTVKPILDTFKGLGSTDDTMIHTRIAHVSPNLELPVPPWSVLTCSKDENLTVYYIGSPGFTIDGAWEENNGKRYYIRSIEQNDAGWPKLVVSDETKETRLTVIKRQNLMRRHPLLIGTNIQMTPRHMKLFKTFEEDIFAHQLVGKANESDQWTFTWAAFGYPSDRIQINHNGQAKEGSWSGTAVFY